MHTVSVRAVALVYRVINIAISPFRREEVQLVANVVTILEMVSDQQVTNDPLAPSLINEGARESLKGGL